MMTLKIDSTNELEEKVFQTTSNLNVSFLQKWLDDSVIKGLSNIYKSLDDSELLDDEENSLNLGSSDLYLLGDVINLLSNIKISL